MARRDEPGKKSSESTGSCREHVAAVTAPHPEMWYGRLSVSWYTNGFYLDGASQTVPSKADSTLPGC